MPIRILILGDIVGTPGRQAATQLVPRLREKHQADLVIANAENAANGSGLTPDQYTKLTAAGIDGITLGDHAFRKQQIYPTLDGQDNIIRPANISAKAKGKGVMRLAIEKNGRTTPIYVVSLIGRLFMNNMMGSDPFACIDQLLTKINEPGALVLVEIHAEATSEKIAMGWHLSGRVACVFGTHTHVPTADARLLPPHVPGSGATAGAPALPTTAYVSDLGMTGPADSVLGRRVDKVLHHLTTNLPAPFDVADGGPMAQGVLVTLDETNGRALAIERIDTPADTTRPPFTPAPAPGGFLPRD